jgi:hypothetical protein
VHRLESLQLVPPVDRLLRVHKETFYSLQTVHTSSVGSSLKGMRHSYTHNDTLRRCLTAVKDRHAPNVVSRTPPSYDCVFLGPQRLYTLCFALLRNSLKSL